MRGRRQRTPRVLFVGHMYYNAWYLSRALRLRGWRADVLNWDASDAWEYPGEDYRFRYRGLRDVVVQAAFYLGALFRYDVFHFSNAGHLKFGNYLAGIARRLGLEGADVRLLKLFGKKVVYSHNGCLDGVAQTTFAAWEPEPVCADCSWRDRPDVCSDDKNLAWGRFRNSVADFQVILGGNRADYNDDPSVHEVPEFYCLDRDVWAPGTTIPDEHIVRSAPGTVQIYHGVGNYAVRTVGGRNIKSTHLWVPIVEALRNEGHPVEMMLVRDVPSSAVRFYQAQADVVVDMLTFGWYGANAREAMMLGKPVICYLRPSWLETVRARVPGYVEELPVVSATPADARDVLRRLVRDPEERRALGERGRAFALKWHSAEAAGDRFEVIYRDLVSGRTAR